MAEILPALVILILILSVIIIIILSDIIICSFFIPKYRGGARVCCLSISADCEQEAQEVGGGLAGICDDDDDMQTLDTNIKSLDLISFLLQTQLQTICFIPQQSERDFV